MSNIKINDLVNVTIRTGKTSHIIPATVVRVFKNGKVRTRPDVAYNGLSIMTVNGADVEHIKIKLGKTTVTAAAKKPRKAKVSKGVKPPVEKPTKTKAELKTEVNDLLTELEATDDRTERMRLRRLLRSRGHYGGLGVKLTLEQHVAARAAGLATAQQAMG